MEDMTRGGGEPISVADHKQRKTRVLSEQCDTCIFRTVDCTLCLSLGGSGFQPMACPGPSGHASPMRGLVSRGSRGGTGPGASGSTVLTGSARTIERRSLTA